MKNSGKAYEHLVQNIYKEILKVEGINNIEVQHNVILKGKTTNHQIDVYWEHEIGYSKFKTVIQAKDWNYKVPQKEMLAFVEIIKDLPTGTKGVFISKSGFQKGTIKVAEANGIDIYELRKPNINDFENKMINIKLTQKVKIPYYQNINITINRTKNPNFNKNGLFVSGGLMICEKNGNKTIQEIILNLCNENGKEIKRSEYLFNEGYTLLNGQKIFIEKLTGNFGITETEIKTNIDGYTHIGMILKNIIEKETKIFDKKNKFFKDIKD